MQEARNGKTYTWLYDPQGRLLPGWLDPGSVEGTHPWLLPAQLQTANVPAANASATLPKALLGLTEFYNISENIGRLGQNLHTLADFYAHTNWVDSKNRGGGCYKRLIETTTTKPALLSSNQYVEESSVGGGTLYYIYELSEVPAGMEKARVWDEHAYVGMFSGTVYEGVYGKKDIFDFTDRNYTHAYWNKDAADPKKNPGGYAGLTSSQKAAVEEQGLYFWQATTYGEISSILKDEKGKPIPPVLGENYLTDNGKPPTYSTDRVYVKKEITNAYELAMALAIKHTMQEIELFYKKASEVVVKNNDDGTKVRLSDALGMKWGELSVNSIKFETYPDKKKAYKE